MKKILIPTDFSLNSYQVIDSVLKLFKNKKCDFYFLNSYAYDVNGLDALELLQADDEWFERPKEYSEENLGRLIQRYTLKYSGGEHDFHMISESSGLVNAVKKHQELLGIDLVVLSSGINESSDKENKLVLEHVRNCPVLLLPATIHVDKNLSITIASDFKQQINTDQIDRFRLGIGSKKIEIGILVLDEQNKLSELVTRNLEIFITYLQQFQNAKVNLEYAKTSSQLKAYAVLHRNGIMCLVDKKPCLMRKIGLFKSDVISKLKQLNSNSVLAVHQ
ncbi:MAG: hypothetical protein GYB35_12030 [Algicola sp.]|nr:hypothetical protein [Algicola sp.]